MREDVVHSGRSDALRAGRRASVKLEADSTASQLPPCGSLRPITAQLCHSSPLVNGTNVCVEGEPELQSTDSVERSCQVSKSANRELAC